MVIQSVDSHSTFKILKALKVLKALKIASLIPAIYILINR